jgi:uroporphyrin-III C-methyltransferase / precorrin-2 dehydrogenase / sirohydrochlorin ferrochelatase
MKNICPNGSRGAASRRAGVNPPPTETGGSHAMPPYFPVFLDLRGQRCVLVGGGDQAAAKLGPLLAAGAEVTVIAEQAGPAIAVAARAGRVSWLTRGFRSGDLDGVRLVIDASHDEATNRLVRRDADREHALLNVVDRTSLCDWIAPAVVNRGALKLAISTSGQSPFLAAAVHDRLEADFGREWAPFTALVGDLRHDLRNRGTPAADQQRIYRATLRSPVRQLLREGRVAEACTLMAGLAAEPEPGRVTIAGAGPGSAELLTNAVREALWQADVVFHDALVEPEVLAVCGRHTRLVNVGKRAGEAPVPQEEINRRLVHGARQGLDVVRLKGGDPFVFGRGGEELAALRQAGIDVRILPGLSSATAAPTLAGIPLTLRGVASSVAICSAQLAHGPARLARHARSADTLVVLMVFARATEVAAELAGILGEDRPAALVSCAGTARQQVVCSPLGELPAKIAGARAASPALLVVGEVVRAARAWRQTGEDGSAQAGACWPGAQCLKSPARRDQWR